MSQKRLTTWQKATALVPLALLSGAWTASLTVTTTATAATKSASLPDGTTIPNEAIEAPASLSQPGSIAPGVPAGAAKSVLATSAAQGIPATALSAYQRATDVINAADPTCRISWQLVAAIGRVESDHGRYGGNTLGEDGLSTPGIYGIPLDGSNGTARIDDTDGGQYDDDLVYDRAVGPMQFIPSTWSVVGVDGDGDGVRNPQDIDDAALASAVYLCSGDEDLSTVAGQRAAVYRYNHSQDYVDLVLSIMNSYLDGDFSSVPNTTAAPTVFTPTPSASSAGTKGGTKVGAKKSGKGTKATAGSGKTGGKTGSNGTKAPEGGGSKGQETKDPVGNVGGGDPVKKDPVKDVTDPVKEVTDPITDPVDDVTGGLTYAEAKAECLLDPANALSPTKLDACIAKALEG